MYSSHTDSWFSPQYTAVLQDCYLLCVAFLSAEQNVLNTKRNWSLGPGASKLQFTGASKLQFTGTSKLQFTGASKLQLQYSSVEYSYSQSYWYWTQQVTLCYHHRSSSQLVHMGTKEQDTNIGKARWGSPVECRPCPMQLYQ